MHIFSPFIQILFCFLNLHLVATSVKSVQGLLVEKPGTLVNVAPSCVPVFLFALNLILVLDQEPKVAVRVQSTSIDTNSLPMKSCCNIIRLVSIQ